MQNSRCKQIVAAFLFCCCSWWPYIEILGRLVLIEIRHDMPRFQKLEEIALEKLSLIPNKNVPQTLWRSQVTSILIANSHFISKMHLMTSSKRHSLKLLWLFQVFRRDQMGLKLFVVPIREVFNQYNEVWQFLKIINMIFGYYYCIKETYSNVDPSSILLWIQEVSFYWLPQPVSFNWRRFSP